MWLWDCELQQLGFRQRSEVYWQCERRFGLLEDAYVSIFANDGNASGRSRSRGPIAVGFCAFHITFQLDVDNVHFYFHEQAENVWEPGGHTSSVEIERHGVDPRALRSLADEIAAGVAFALGGTLLAR